MIKLDKVSKSFGDQEVLHEISGEFLPGQTNLIIGISGSGKTVLMKCMVGLLEVDSGSIFYDDVEFSALNDKERKNIRQEIGMLFQGNALFDSLTVEQNVMFPLDMFTTMTREEKLEQVNEVLNRVRLENANHKYPSEISGGMQKRVGIARAIVLRPKYLFCDEPNSGLDPKTALVIDKLIQEITTESNITTIINTHDMNSVMEIGDHISFLYDGKKEWEGSRSDIIHSQNENLNSFIFASDFLKEAKLAKMKKEGN